MQIVNKQPTGDSVKTVGEMDYVSNGVLYKGAQGDSVLIGSETDLIDYDAPGVPGVDITSEGPEGYTREWFEIGDDTK